MATENSNVNLYINTKGAEASLKNLQSDATKLKNELRLLSPTSQEFADKAKQFQEVNGRINELNGTLRGTNTALSSLKGEVKNTIPFFGQFQAAKDKLNLVKAAVIENATAMNILKVSMAAIPIFALIAGISALVVWFKKTDDGARTLDGIIKGVSNTFDVLLNRVLNIGDTLKQLFTNPVDFFKNFSKDVVEATKAGIEFANMVDAIDEKQRNLDLANSERKKQITRLILQSKNRTLSESERIKLLEQASALETKSLNETISLQDEKIKLAQKEASQYEKQYGKNDELERKLIDAKIERNKLEQDSLNLQEKIKNREDALLDAKTKAQEKANEKSKKDAEKYAKDLLDLQKYIEDTRLSLIKDSHAKELAELDSKFESEFAKYGEDQSALNLMTEKYRLDKQAITDKYKQLETEKTLADAQLGFDLLAEQTKNNFLSGQITEEQYQESIYQLQLGYETKKLQLLQDSGTAKQLELEKQQGVILQLQSDHAKNEVTLNAAKNQKKLDNERATSQQVGNVLSSLGNFTSTLMKVQGKNSKELAVANKVIAGIELAANSARAISAATASGASLPFPANIAAIAAGVIAVVSNVVQATAMLNEGNDGPDANIQSAPSYSGSGFKVGGFTGSGNSNDIAGPAHYNEYVIPDYVVANPQFDSTIQMLEMARQRKSVQSVPNSPTPLQNVSFPSQMRLSKDDLDYLAEKLNDKKVVLSNSEFDITQKDRTKVRTTNQY